MAHTPKHKEPIDLYNLPKPKVAPKVVTPKAVTPVKPKGKSLEEKMRDDKANQRQMQEDKAIKAKERQDATTPRGKTLGEWIRSRTR